MILTLPVAVMKNGTSCVVRDTMSPDGSMMHKAGLFVVVLIPLMVISSPRQISISDEEYEGRPHFKIEASGYTAFYDIKGGGFSRLIDPGGVDWIAFKMEPWDTSPASAASAFRGLPNLVFREEDGGCGHPGFDKCASSIVSRNKIKSTSLSGKWEWEWIFYENYAELAILKTDTTRTYWFLYEGPVGGVYDPQNCLWANNIHGFRSDLVSLNLGEIINGDWHWASFGHLKNDHVLSIAQVSTDTSSDSYSWMGDSQQGIQATDGMMVFGFGRNKGKPSLKGTNKYRIGFVEINPSHPNAYSRVQSEMGQWSPAPQ